MLTFRKMRGSKLIPGVVAFMAVATALTAFLLWKGAERAFKGTTAITFTELGFGRPDKKFTVVDPNEVQRLVKTIRLKRKEQCSCSHVHEATFEKPGERIKTSFCNHCFAVLGAMQNGWYPNARDYWMPQEFYAEFRRLALSRTNEHWQVLPLRMQ